MASNEHHNVVGSGPGGAMNPVLIIVGNAVRVADGIAGRLEACPAI